MSSSSSWAAQHTRGEGHGSHGSNNPIPAWRYKPELEALLVFRSGKIIIVFWKGNGCFLQMCCAELRGVVHGWIFLSQVIIPYFVKLHFHSWLQMETLFQPQKPHTSYFLTFHWRNDILVAAVYGIWWHVLVTRCHLMAGCGDQVTCSAPDKHLYTTHVS